MNMHKSIMRVLDYSTIHLDLLRQQPVYKKPSRYSFDTEPGCGCAGNPPGYPTYFLWMIDAPKEKQPGSWCTDPDDPRVVGKFAYPCCSPDDPCWLDGYVITDPDDFNCHYVMYPETLQQFWKPLPEDHPRVQCWLHYMYSFHYGYSEDHKHNVLKLIRRYYPDHQAKGDWLKNPPKGIRTEWWTTLSAGPLKPEQMPNPLPRWWLETLSDEEIVAYDPLFGDFGHISVPFERGRMKLVR